MRLSEGLDIALLAKLTPGFVGADLSALTKEAPARQRRGAPRLHQVRTHGACFGPCLSILTWLLCRNTCRGELPSAHDNRDTSGSNRTGNCITCGIGIL